MSVTCPRRCAKLLAPTSFKVGLLPLQGQQPRLAFEPAIEQIGDGRDFLLRQLNLLVSGDKLCLVPGNLRSELLNALRQDAELRSQALPARVEDLLLPADDDCNFRIGLPRREFRGKLDCIQPVPLRLQASLQRE